MGCFYEELEKGIFILKCEEEKKKTVLVLEMTTQRTHTIEKADGGGVDLISKKKKRMAGKGNGRNPRLLVTDMGNTKGVHEGEGTTIGGKENKALLDHGG